MIGTTQIAKVVGNSFSKVNPAEGNGVFVELLGGVKGHLHISQMLGKTREERARTLSEMAFGAELEVDVVDETAIDGEPGFRVSQWSYVRRARKETAVASMEAHRSFRGIIQRIGENYAIVQLPDDLQGLLHVSRMFGDSEEERTARFAALVPEQSVHVEISEVIEAHGRVRVRLGQITA